MSTTLPSAKLRAVQRGDTWQGLGMVQIELNEAGMDLTGATITMQLRRRPAHGTAVATWSTTNGTITFLDAAAGTFKVHPRIMDFQAGVYHWDIELKLASGRIMTIARGTLELVQDVTR